MTYGNIPVTPGFGVPVATDTVGGVVVQRVKLGIGAEGQAVDLAFGQGGKAASLPVTIASDDDVQAKLGAVNEVAPFSDVAAAGINGRLQRIAQRLTSLIGVLPAGLGQAAKAASLTVTLASDDDLQGKIGAPTEIAPANDTASSGLNGRLQRIAQRITSLIALLPTALGQGTMAQSLRVVLPSDQSTIGVNQVSAAYDVKVTMTRPADTIAYAAGDVVGGAISFANVGPSAAAVMVTGTELEIDVSSVPSGMTSFRLHFYNVTPPSALADSAAFDLPSGDRASYLGFIDIGSPSDLGSTLYVSAENINKQVKLSGTGLFGYLVTTGAFTPGSADVFKLTLHTQAV